MGLAAAGLAACPRPPVWLASPSVEPAQAPGVPVRCGEPRLVFRPERAALLGAPPGVLREWAAVAFPDHFRVGGRGQFGLVPNSAPGAALMAATRYGQVVFLSVQSHDRSAASAAPLAAEALREFLRQATGCSSYRLCDARVDLDEARYRGYTTCPSVQVPVRVVTARNGRGIVGVATWLPLFEAVADEDDAEAE